MRKYTHRSLSVLLVATVCAAAACGGGDAPATDDARDVSLPATTVEPELQDVPVTVAEAAAPPSAAPPPAPRPRPAAPPPAAAPAAAPAPAVAAATPPGPARVEFGEIAPGSNLVVRTAAVACTDTHKVGDRFTASVAETVSGTEGVSIPAGATATMQVTESVRGENDMNKVRFAFRVVSLTFGGNTYDVVGTEVADAKVDIMRRQTTGDQAKKVATGAAVGAIAGQILGRNTRSTVVGGAVGAAAGAVAANATADYDGCLAADSRVTIKLTQGLKIRLAAGE
jgi:hypothetical protein